MAVVIAVANQKGGVAKTTSTHNLGVALAQQSKSVLMVDLDSQASLTISLAKEPLENENNIVAVFDGSVNITDCIMPIAENLYLIPSIIDLAKMEMEMIAKPVREGILGRALAPIKERFDYILIDCPPQLSILTVNAICCADYILIPVKTDYLSYRGLTQLNETIDELKELANPKLEVLGILATLYDVRQNDDKAILEMLQDKYDVLGVTRMLAAARKGIYEGKAAVENDPKSELSQEYVRVANIIIERCGQ